MSNIKKMFFNKTGLANYNSAFAFYSLRNIFENWTNAVVKIRRSSDDATAFIFFDSNQITTSSLISTSSDTTPSATTLSTWIGSDNGFVEKWYSLFLSNSIGHYVEQTTLTKQPQIITSGLLNTKNGTVAIDFDGIDDNISGVSISNLDSGNSFTIFTVTSNEFNSFPNSGTILAIGDIISPTSADRFVLANDRRSVKRNVVIRANNVTYFADNLVQDNSNSQKLQGFRMKSDKNFISLKDGYVQDSNQYVGSYDNDAFYIGSEFGAGATENYIEGYIQEIIGVPVAETISNLQAIQKEINLYYSIY